MLARNKAAGARTGESNRDADKNAPASPVDTEVLDKELRPGWSRAMPEHIPEPTYWPVTLALGIAVFIWSLIATPLLALPGLILFVVALAGWIGEMRNDNDGRHGS